MGLGTCHKPFLGTRRRWLGPSLLPACFRPLSASQLSDFSLSSLCSLPGTCQCGSPPRSLTCAHAGPCSPTRSSLLPSLCRPAQLTLGFVDCIHGPVHYLFLYPHSLPSNCSTLSFRLWKVHEIGVGQQNEAEVTVCQF